MKAMVVFEVDDLDDVVVYANVYKREQGWKRQIGRLECVKPVPMPQKKEVEVNEIEDIMRTEYSIEDIYTNKYVATIRLATDKLISIGWNACLEEIEKC